MGINQNKMGNSSNKGTLSEPSELRSFNDLLRVNGVSQLKAITAAVIDGEISDALNSEDGCIDYWTYDTKTETHQIYRWCTGGVWVGGACLRGETEMRVEISDGQFSASDHPDKSAKDFAKELQAAFDDQAAERVETELAETDEEASDDEDQPAQLSPEPMSPEPTRALSTSAESEDEVSCAHAETEAMDKAFEELNAANVIESEEPMPDVAVVSAPPAKRSSDPKAVAAPVAPKRSTRSKAKPAVIEEDNSSCANSVALSAVTSEPLPIDLKKMKVVDLRQELKARQQVSSGLKKDLVKRLQDVLKADVGQVA